MTASLHRKRLTHDIIVRMSFVGRRFRLGGKKEAAGGVAAVILEIFMGIE
jgi:hypothetical protein